MIKKNNKKNILLIGLPICILIIIIVSLILLINKDNSKEINNPDGIRFKEEYEKLNNIKDEEGNNYPEVTISSNNIIKYSYEQEIVNIFNNKEDAVVYFGYPTCNYCRSSIEILLNTAKDSKLDTIYYIDTKKIDISEELLNILGEDLTTDNGVYTSLVIFITDGQIVSYNKDTLSSHTNPNIKLNQSQIEGLSEIFKYGISDVIDSKNIKKQK